MQLVCGKASCTQPATLAVANVLAVRPGDERPGLQRPDWSVADLRVDQGNVAVRRFGATRPSGLCSLSASLNGQLINTTTSAQDVSTLASVRGAGDQSAGGHDPVWAGRGAADA